MPTNLGKPGRKWPGFSILGRAMIAAEIRGRFGFMQTKRYAFHFCTAIIVMDQWTVYEKCGKQMDSMIELLDLCL